MIQEDRAPSGSMELQEALDGRSRHTRILLTALLAVVAVQSLRKGKRLRGILAGLVAVATGYSVVNGSGDVMKTLDDEATETLDSVTGTDDTERSRDRTELRCAACGDPIVPGQARTPNENHETVHEACLENPV